MIPGPSPLLFCFYPDPFAFGWGRQTLLTFRKGSFRLPFPNASTILIYADRGKIPGFSLSEDADKCSSFADCPSLLPAPFNPETEDFPPPPPPNNPPPPHPPPPKTLPTIPSIPFSALGFTGIRKRFFSRPRADFTLVFCFSLQVVV